MIRDFNIAPDANINPSKIMGGGMGLMPVAETYYVDRNVGKTGDGMSLQSAFLTFGEAIGQVNEDYAAGAANGKSRGRMRRIMVAEGWYGEIPLLLTASDVHIVGIAPGHHDSVVLYGSATHGGFDVGAGGPALTLSGSNCTLENFGLFTHDAAEAALANGVNGSSGPYGNKFLNLNFVRDVADGCDGGLLDMGEDGTLIEGCFFSTSQATYGVKSMTNGVANPVNVIVRACRFVGTPTGILQANGHNGLYYNNIFFDDTSDRADTCDTPIVITATSGMAFENYAQGVNAADVVTGAGTILEIRNFGADS